MPFPNETKLFPYKRKSTAFPCVIQMTIGRLPSGWEGACPVGWKRFGFIVRKNAV